MRWGWVIHLIQGVDPPYLKWVINFYPCKLISGTPHHYWVALKLRTKLIKYA